MQLGRIKHKHLSVLLYEFISY